MPKCEWIEPFGRKSLLRRCTSCWMSDITTHSFAAQCFNYKHDISQERRAYLTQRLGPLWSYAPNAQLSTQSFATLLFRHSSKETCFALKALLLFPTVPKNTMRLALQQHVEQRSCKKGMEITRKNSLEFKVFCGNNERKFNSEHWPFLLMLRAEARRGKQNRNVTWAGKSILH